MVRAALNSLLALSLASAAFAHPFIETASANYTARPTKRPDVTDIASQNAEVDAPTRNGLGGDDIIMDILEFCRLSMAGNYSEICGTLSGLPASPGAETRAEPRITDGVVWGGKPGVQPRISSPSGPTTMPGDPDWIPFEPQITVTVVNTEDPISTAFVPDPTVTVCKAVKPVLPAPTNHDGTLTRYVWTATVTESVRHWCPTYCGPSLALETFRVGGQGPVAVRPTTTITILAERTATVAGCPWSSLAARPGGTGTHTTTHTVTSTIPLAGSWFLTLSIPAGR
ncbi:hypothetical protein QBC33DRAFT_560301 [Phialemonium atrogriseum]|uniref:Uncharacterized protein n=1 Tax=Phialemonium atrogriseum TaxID=1093897 RepID=A0AAJ0BWP3_9PEZI|nr:uncharacterized protein QBC33DRAFT_560301 [Phialemonium atrogriseum]KAK1765863.1 hypothetical protein QBC33DRAFT_560301 [Phialemonium atrogriseum]